MLRTIFFVFILSSPNLEVLCFSNQIYTIDLPKSLSSDHIISPDSYDNTFTIARFTLDTSLQTLFVDLSIENKEKRVIKECSLSLVTRRGVAEAGVSTLRRLKGTNKVVFSVYDELINDLDHRARIIAVDLNDCRSSDLGISELLQDPIIVPSVHGRFDVIIEDYERCEEAGNRCLIRYKSDFENYTEPIPFDVDFEWSTIHADRSDNPNDNGEIVVRGYDEHSLVHQIVTIDGFTGKKVELESFESIDRQVKVVSSGLSFCRVNNPMVDSTVYCSQYDENGELILSMKAEFDIAITPIAVRTVKEGEIFFIIGKSYCASNEQCWDLVGVKMVFDNDYGIYDHMKFECEGNRDDVVVFDVRQEADRMKVTYACRHEDKYSYGSNEIDVMKDDEHRKILLV